MVRRPPRLLVTELRLKGRAADFLVTSGPGVTGVSKSGTALGTERTLLSI